MNKEIVKGFFEIGRILLGLAETQVLDKLKIEILEKAEPVEEPVTVSTQVVVDEKRQRMLDHLAKARAAKQEMQELTVHPPVTTVAEKVPALPVQAPVPLAAVLPLTPSPEKAKRTRKPKEVAEKAPATIPIQQKLILDSFCRGPLRLAEIKEWARNAFVEEDLLEFDKWWKDFTKTGEGATDYFAVWGYTRSKEVDAEGISLFSATKIEAEEEVPEDLFF